MDIFNEWLKKKMDGGSVGGASAGDGGGISAPSGEAEGGHSEPDGDEGHGDGDHDADDNGQPRRSIGFYGWFGRRIGEKECKYGRKQDDKCRKKPK
jgi:hypothetical protein